MVMSAKEKAKYEVGMLDLPTAIEEDVKNAMLAIIEAIPDGEDHECLCEYCKMFDPKKKRRIR